MYRSYSYSNMPEPITKNNSPNMNKFEKNKEKAYGHDDIKKTQSSSIEKSSSKLKNDDVILLIIAAILVTNGCDDKLLLASLIYIFISGYRD